MLRLAIRAVAILFLIGAVAMTIWQPAQWPVLIVPLLLVLGIFYERRYAGLSTTTVGGSGDFRPSGERFVDPETGRINSVLVDPRTGARRYVRRADRRFRVPDKQHVETLQKHVAGGCPSRRIGLSGRRFSAGRRSSCGSA